MQHRQLEFTSEFKVTTGNVRSQAAVMVIPPGGHEGGSDNKHKGSDQWLYVVEGQGKAIVQGRSQALAPGSLLLIERGEVHEIRNEGKEPLRTLNFYLPPAYDAEGEALPPGQST